MEDVEFIYRLRSDGINNPYNGRQPYRHRRQAVDFVRAALHEMAFEALFYWIVEWEGVAVGTICLWNLEPSTGTIEIGYEILPEYRRRGLAGAALRRALEFGELQERFTTYEAYVHPENVASLRMLHREGFRQGVLSTEQLTDRPEGFVRLLLDKTGT